MSGIRIMNSAAPAGQERMMIMNDVSGGQLRLFPGSNQVVLATIGGEVFRSEDSGDSYVAQGDAFPTILSATANRLNTAISFNNRYYFIGDASTQDSVYWLGQSNDFGNSWTYDISGGFTDQYMRFRNVAGSRDGRYVLATNGQYQDAGDVWLTQDFGETWTKEFSGQSYYGCFADPTGMNMIVGGYTSTTRYSDDYGDTWSNFVPPMNAFMGAMVSGDGNYKVAWEQYNGSGSRVYVSTDWTNWEETKLTTRLSGGCISNDGKYMLIASSDAFTSSNSNVNVSNDYGVTWSQIDLTGGEPEFWNGSAMSSDGKYQTVIAGAAGSAGCYKSIDYGATWNIITEIPEGAFSTVQMSKSGRYTYITAYNDGIWNSKDYMGTWEQQFDGSTGSGCYINF
jgi:photosystem II stability/assembly factor-like uncharacterized protein